MHKVLGLVPALSLSALLAVAAPHQAFAQDGCSCVTPMPAAQSVVGSITQFTGEVMLTGATQIAQIEGPSDLAIGSDFTTGAASSAIMSVGSCNLGINANLRVQVTQQENNICIRVTEDTIVPPVPTNSQTQAGGGGFGGALPILAGVAGAGAAAGVLFFSLGQEDPASQ